jgi:hypothetical protein
MDINHLEAEEQRARTWGEQEHPDASPQHHAAFVNAATYALFRFTGRYGGPSVREHAASTVLNESDVADWAQRPREELYRFLEPVVYGSVSDIHIKTWVMLKDICFDDDPTDIEALNEAAKGYSLTTDGRFASTRIWPQSLRKLRMIAAMRDESVVETIDRLANEEFARLRYSKQ